MNEVNELKAQVYDLIVTIEQHQMAINKAQKKIQELTKQINEHDNTDKK